MGDRATPGFVFDLLQEIPAKACIGVLIEEACDDLSARLPVVVLGRDETYDLVGEVRRDLCKLRAISARPPILGNQRISIT
jgi:hypothetical protein